MGEVIDLFTGERIGSECEVIDLFTKERIGGSGSPARIRPPRRPLSDLEASVSGPRVLKQEDPIRKAANCIVASAGVSMSEEGAVEAVQQDIDEALMPLDDDQQQKAWELAEDMLFDI